MRLLLDTTVFVDVLRGLDAAVGFLTKAVQGDFELWSLTVVRTEVLAGMREREQEQTHELLDTVRWLPVTVEVADRAGELARFYLRSHPGVDTVDYLIAAGAEVLEAQLCTSNTKHFPMFDVEPAYR